MTHRIGRACAPSVALALLAACRPDPAPVPDQPAAVHAASAPADRAALRGFLGAYVVVTTDSVVPAVRFHRAAFGLATVFESSWFVLLGDSASGAPVVAFMRPDHPSAPPGPERYAGDGLLLTLNVADARAACARAEAAGARLERPLTDEPWGQRRCLTTDPAGVEIDVVEQIEPEAGWWEKHP